jgi:hypothetical protein
MKYRLLGDCGIPEGSFRDVSPAGGFRVTRKRDSLGKERHWFFVLYRAKEWYWSLVLHRMKEWNWSAVLHRMKEGNWSLALVRMKEG